MFNTKLDVIRRSEVIVRYVKSNPICLRTVPTTEELTRTDQVLLFQPSLMMYNN